MKPSLQKCLSNVEFLLQTPSCENKAYLYIRTDYLCWAEKDWMRERKIDLKNKRNRSSEEGQEQEVSFRQKGVSSLHQLSVPGQPPLFYISFLHWPDLTWWWGRPWAQLERSFSSEAWPDFRMERPAGALRLGGPAALLAWGMPQALWCSQKAGVRTCMGTLLGWDSGHCLLGSGPAPASPSRLRAWPSIFRRSWYFWSRFSEWRHLGNSGLGVNTDDIS